MSGPKRGKPKPRSPARPRRKAAAGKRQAPARPTRRPWGRWLRAGLKWSATAGVWAFIGVLGLVAWYATDLPDVDKALEATRRPTVTLVAADGSELLARGDLYGLPVQLKELPPALPQAVMATEDRRFRDHFGLDVIGLARALVANIRAGGIVQGGSTITQQVAKNLFLTPERTLKRKVQELLLALWLEHKFTKDQILTLYLNRVYLGAGTYGVEAAAQKYFGHSARRVSTFEAALLAGLLKAPSRYNPLADPDRAHARTRVVLDNMVAAGYLSEAQARTVAEKKQLQVAVKRRRGLGRYFADWVLDRVHDYVSPGDHDLTVVTTLDPAMQDAAEKAVRGVLAEHGKAREVSQGALVALAPDGAVRALVGGRDWRESQFNRATQARRQPGSAFKPIVYLAALEAGVRPDDMVRDAPITIDDWSPTNYADEYRGPIPVRRALAESVNTAAVRLAEKAGREAVVRTARRLGITADLTPRPSLALGAEEVTLLDLAAAYGAFASGGRGLWPFGISEIRDASGRVLYRRSGGGPGRVVAPDQVARMNAMLTGVIDHGTGKRARLDRPAAGKTGTSQDFRDAWFVGYTADLVAGVWLGNDDGRPTAKVTGGSLPALVWKRFMTAAHRGRPVRPLPGLDGPGAASGGGEGLWGAIVQWAEERG